MAAWRISRGVGFCGVIPGFPRALRLCARLAPSCPKWWSFLGRLSKDFLRFAEFFLWSPKGVRAFTNAEHICNQATPTQKQIVEGGVFGPSAFEGIPTGLLLV